MSQMKECNLCLSVKDIQSHFISKRGKETKSCSICLYAKNQKKKEYRNMNKDKVKTSRHRYYIEHKQDKLDYGLKYRKQNKEQLKHKYMVKFNCDCGGRYIYNHKRKHERTKKHQKYLNKCSSLSKQ